MTVRLVEQWNTVVSWWQASMHGCRWLLSAKFLRTNDEISACNIYKWRQLYAIIAFCLCGTIPGVRLCNCWWDGACAAAGLTLGASLH